MVRIILNTDFSYLWLHFSIYSLKYLETKCYFKLFNINIVVVCYILVSFPWVCFFFACIQKNRYYSKGVWLRILFPNLFVLFASDAVLVVVYLSFLFREVFPLLIFLVPFPGVDRWYNFHLVLLWMFLSNGEIILRIEETFGTFGDG